MEAMRAGGVAAVSPNGVLGDPTGAGAGHGRDLLEAATDELVATYCGLVGGSAMSERVSVIFGGGRGIGAATARCLAARGDAVVIADRASDDPRLGYSMASASELEATAGAARDAAGADADRVLAVVADATDPVSVAGVIDAAEARFGGVDTIVVTAGVIAGGLPLWEMPEAELRAVLDVDLGAVITVGASRNPSAAAPAGAAQRSPDRGRLNRRIAWPADAGRILRGEGGRRWADQGSRRRTAGQWSDRQRSQSRFHRYGHSR